MARPFGRHVPWLGGVPNLRSFNILEALRIRRRSCKQKEELIMKLSTILLAPIVAVGMATTALAGDYKDLVAEGYRWATIDGPYLYRTKEDLREMARDPSDLNTMRMVEERGIEEDRSSGMAQVRAAGITMDVWTYNKFLSRRPVKDAYGQIETPERSDFTPAERVSANGSRLSRN
jgi:hypothetical protein